MNNKLPMETKNELFGLILYPMAEEIRIRQQDILWTAEEIPVEKDVNDFRQNMLPEQFNLASITLDLFVETEQEVGNIWATISSWFPHSEIDNAATQIAAVEKAVHAPFYQKMSDTMNIAPEDTAANQQNITVIREKLVMLKSIASNLDADKPLSMATVSLIEQVLLFGNFAMLKSFQANGHNLITNTITGVDFVKNDEVLHGIFATYLHNTWWDEYKPTPEELQKHYDNVHTIAREIIAHEDAVIDYVYKGIKEINDITPAQLKAFVRSRTDMILSDLKIPTLYEISSNPIGEWFYKGANSIKIHDFFTSGTNSYRRSWKTENLSRLPFITTNTGEIDA
jgi:ribonucleotide reductase beta subunit family protein with ferritin-like domain